MGTFEFWNDADNPVHPASAPDYLPRAQLRDLQLHRLRVVVARAFERVPLFRQRMRARGLQPAHLRTLEDLASLPFTLKGDLRDTYPFGLLASPMADVVRLHASSGTTGKPIVVAYTANDMEVWKSVIVRTLAAADVRRDDIIQNCFGYGLFTGGLGVHYGAEAMGATVIPMSGGNTDRQIMVMRDFGVTVVCSTPSYFLHLADAAQQQGVDLRALKLRVGVFGAEPWSDGMRERIQQMTGVKAHDIYGLSEIIGPGVAAECGGQCGLHIFEDHFYPEIIDPETGAVLPDGATGELVLTTLSKEAMPMIRYRTRDLSRLIPEPCACGRTIRRLQRISARSDDMLIIRGVNVYPSQIETALMSIEAALPHYQIILTREEDLDQVEVKVEVPAAHFTGELHALEPLQRRIAGAITRITGIHAHVRLVEPNTLARSEGKAKRVLDQRKM